VITGVEVSQTVIERAPELAHSIIGDEHDKDTNPNAVPSYCTLPLFHEPADAADAPPLGHISQDGHAYNCKNPAEMQRSFHM
jgi:hypothetical protein